MMPNSTLKGGVEYVDTLRQQGGAMTRGEAAAWWEANAPGGGVSSGGERPGHQATQCNKQPNKRGATRGRGLMRGGGKAKAPDNMTQCKATTNKWGGMKRGGGAGWEVEGGHGTTRQPTEQVGWGTIAQQKVEAPAEGVGKAERAADKRRQCDESGATTMMTIQ